MLWSRRDVVKHSVESVRQFESALNRNAADVYDVRARAYAEFEEIEDEGACYAFELEGDRLLFISGQEFYPAAKWPSLDFSLVYILDEQDHSIDMLVEKRGPKALPARTIPSSVKQRINIPAHLETHAGNLDNIELL